MLSNNNSRPWLLQIPCCAFLFRHWWVFPSNRLNQENSMNHHKLKNELSHSSSVFCSSQNDSSNGFNYDYGHRPNRLLEAGAYHWTKDNRKPASYKISNTPLLDSPLFTCLVSLRNYLGLIRQKDMSKNLRSKGTLIRTEGTCLLHKNHLYKNMKNKIWTRRYNSFHCASKAYCQRTHWNEVTKWNCTMHVQLLYKLLNAESNKQSLLDS